MTYLTHNGAVRAETDAEIIANLKRKGGVETEAPPAPEPAPVVVAVAVWWQTKGQQALISQLNTEREERMDGMDAEIGLWNAALTADEAISLAKGFSPAKIRPQSLVFYAPLVRELIDIKGLSITNNNGAAVAPHPRVYG